MNFSLCPMKHHPLSLLLAALALGSTVQGEVVIDELMYHPQSENSAEEYVELFNSGAAHVDVSGWKFTKGVQFTFPAGTTIAPGGYLVVAADGAAFAAKYPGVTNFVAGWSGTLSNSGNKVKLEDALGATRDEVNYADDGDWAERRRDDLPNFGHRGWGWHSDADGHGKSLELINGRFDNSTGQNWAASTAAEGTPGTANSVAANDIAPVISKVEHFPLVPHSADSVTITCQVADDHAATPTVQLHYRNDGAATFSTSPMYDDGAHGDALAGDGIYGEVLLPRAAGTIVEFYITATDGALTRTWPAPARDFTGALVQSQNCLYQVDDTVYPGAMPLYRMVLRAADRAELTQINTNSPSTPPFAFHSSEARDQTYSHAKFNATFISQDGAGAKLRYLAGVRNRGNGSRYAQPQSFAVLFPNADLWNGQTGINLNTQETPYQLFGSALFRKAGLAMAESRAVQVRMNATNPASSAGGPAYGMYVCNERQNSEFADHHFPLDSSGNLYRGQRLVRGTTSGGTKLGGADLGSITPAPGETLSPVDLYKLNYFKETNTSEDAWSDLIGLTQALAKGHSNASFQTTYDADYVASVEAAVDVTQWMRFLAVNTFADNVETNIANGDGDDYYLYFGKSDPRAKLIAYDLDSIVGRSSASSNPLHGIFRMSTSTMSGNPPTPLNAFMRHPKFAPIYYAELKRLLDGAFSATQFDPLVDAVLGSVAPGNVINAIKTFNATRHAYIAGQVPLAISVLAKQETNGTALAALNGYTRTTNPACTLIGLAPAVETRSVKVNGTAATWSAWEAKWTAANVALTPGVNRVLIQAFDAAGAEIDHAYTDVWHDNATQVTVSGAIATNTTWTAAGGPYRVDGSLSISSGATLTIQPGATVWLGASGSTVNVTVASGGRILAEGTEAQPIRFMALPGATYTWGGIIINGGVGTPESRIAHAYIEGNNTVAIDVNGADVVLDHLQFGNTAQQYLSLDGASFLVSHCIFPSGTASFELTHGTLGIKAGGRGIIRDCFFGKTTGYNDVLDFTGGNRPGPILQFINNVCIGSDDDILDLDGTDAWVEGNIFMNVHRNGSPDSASAVSGGNDSSNTSQVTVIGNLFYDVDQVATMKQGNFATLLNNTVVDQNRRGSQDAVTAVLNLSDDGTTAGAGMYLEGNIIHSALALARNYNPAQSVVTLNNNLLPMPWTGPGSGNSVVEPLLVDVANIATPTPQNYRLAAAQLRAQFGLQSNSPGRGTGPNGTDKGGIRPLGVSLGGAPTGTTNQTSATLTVGTLMTGNGIPLTTGAWPNGSGWTHYQWRLDGGAWSAETPVATAITLTGLANGAHTVEVVGRNDAGFYQNHPDFGANARLTSATWTVDTAYTPPPASTQVRINEVLAKNSETVAFGSTLPDIIELYNPAPTSVDLTGWGLTDNASLPFKYTFPAGSTIAPGQHLVLYASSSANVPQPRTGFALKDQGDTLTLTRSAAAGGGVADRVTFGAQLPDYSIGRSGNGAWALCRPTFGAPNVLANTAPISAVKINEWLADAAVLAGQDFVELMNTGTLPADIGLAYLTDNPSDWPQRHQIRQLTFIAPGGYVVFKADSDPEQGPDHLRFKLAPEQGEIGLFSPALALVDSIVYGPQRTDVSEGRTPNGASTIAFFAQPTPGGPNPGATGTTTATVNLIPVAHPWKHRSDGSDQSANFFAPDLDDSAWASGAQLLYIESDPLTSASGFTKQTVLPGDPANSNRPFNAHYFRTHFNYSGPLTEVALQATVMIDDGAVFYLNGHEILPASGNRLRMPAGAVNFSTIATGNVGNATEETLTFDAAWLKNGDNVLCVAVHQQHSGSTQSSTDVVFGVKLDALISKRAGLGGLVLNEVLTINATQQNPDGSYAGWIELFNPTDTAISLADVSLSDTPTAPRKFVFPPGASIPAGGYYVVHCNPLATPSATNTGFAFHPDGGAVLLFEPLSAGGGLHSSVAYGRQIPDFAIGRWPNGGGAFALCVPTRGALNEAAGTAPLTSVRINEWLAAPSSGPDFLELYNTGAQPVALGGSYLTDRLTEKTKSLIPPLSFIGSQGASRWQVWTADGDNRGRPGHVSFELAASGEAIGLYSASGVALDIVSFGPQATGLSGGRFTDGASAILTLMPTPGAANQLPSSNIDTDGDGIPDAWETANGLNPLNSADGAEDADGDGQSNRAEYLAGTNPRDSADVLRAHLWISDGVPTVRFTAVAGKGYSVQYKTALSDPVWTKLTDIEPPAATMELDVQDITLPQNAIRFYRVVTPAQP